MISGFETNASKYKVRKCENDVRRYRNREHNKPLRQ